MFNLERAFSDWRRAMLAAGVKAPVPLEELESHLREDFLKLVSAGKPEAEAFQLAVSRLGNPASVRMEFDKIKRTPITPVKIGSTLWIAATILTAALLSRRLFNGRLDLVLYAHIVTVTAGYCAVYLIGSFGICYVCYRSFHALSPVRQQSLDHAVQLFSYLATALVIVGTVLGMIWSKQHWGKYWGWDPREIGALSLSVWLVALTAMQRFRQKSDRATMLMCIGANVIVSLAWFGANIIVNNSAKHGYGLGHYWPLGVFLALQFCFLIMGFAPSDEVPAS
ncbi:MAG TPA: cytochrome c biogenesis protein CcsA [Verrucomicrobiae bacterium]|jgi:hypothetical protein|nr:cytochrome c biogenesis protein CcsA [Verrucomicrobiae bacterium]